MYHPRGTRLQHKRYFGKGTVERALVAGAAVGVQKAIDSMPSKTTKRTLRGSRLPGPQSNKTKKLTNRVNRLAKSLKSDQAIHTHRRRNVLAAGCNAGEVNNVGVQSLNTTTLEDAMAFLRYYNPAVPGTLTTADANTGTYNRQIHFASIATKFTVRNNYKVPCHISIYSCTPKHDTNIAPMSFYGSGATDQGGVATTSPLLFPSDIQLVKENWSMKRVKNTLLQPGAQTSASHYLKGIDYNPSVVDTHTLQFQKKYGGHQWVVRIEGVIGHDTVAADYLTMQSQVDTIVDFKFVITYDAGVNLNDFSVDDNSSASFTNSGVVSNKPASSNQAYSLT